MGLLDVLEAADFNWTKHIDKVWSDDDTDVAGIHNDTRRDFVKALDRLLRQEDSASPLGWVVTGPGGSGKTHLLGAFRRETLERDGFFILADMSGVKDFWETILLHLIRSIRKPWRDDSPQTMRLLDRIAKTSNCGVDGDALPGMFRDDLAAAIKKIINGLYRHFDVQTQEFQDVLRAVAMLASEDIDISDCGRQWLLGLEPDAEAVKLFGFKHPVCDAKRAVEGMSWLMSLDGGFSVFALDQLDAIIKQHYRPGVDIAGREASTARSIIVSICDGLMTLRDITRRTLIVVSCLNDSWSCLSEFGLKTAVDRYQNPVRLASLDAQAQAEALVAARMSRAFARAKTDAPYPAWPFPPAVLGEMTTLSPRLVLQRCDHHIRGCLAEGVAREAVPQSDNEPEPVLVDEVSALQKRVDAVGKRYRLEVEKVAPAELRDAGRIDDFWHPALACFARAFCCEQPPFPDADITFDDDDQTESKFPLLHAKLRFETTSGSTRDRHLGLRALLHPNARAFQNRLKAAMTQSGIDRNLSFRKLILVRFDSFPGGKVTGELLEKFKSSGGKWVEPSDEDIRRFAALLAVEKTFPGDWTEWVMQAKPTRDIAFARKELEWLLGSTPEDVDASGNNDAPVQQAVSLVDDTAAPRAGEERPRIPVGKRVTSALAEGQGSEITLSLETLKQHVAILAGSGSGKTVLTRRLVEEAALCGIPSIVIDIANDLARLGQPWPDTPPSWDAADRDKAKRYFEQVDVKIWTPGRSAGNPLRLRQIPDLAAVADDEDELAIAVSMALGALGDILQIGKSNTKKGIVAAALRWIARNGGGDLKTLADVLADLPEDSEARINEKAEKMAGEMSSNLRGALLANLLPGGAGKPTDIGQLLAGEKSRTRISVVNLSGLGGIEAQQMYVNQLAMTLFGWIKKHPTHGLGGLLVIDEAKDFIPALKSTPCKDSVLRFAAQARKYGMGLLLATQEPKSVDTKIISNCSTQFFGRQNSPATIEAAESLLGRKGVDRLERGCFFLKSIELNSAPVRITAPLCLSNHPPSPLSGDEVLKLSRG